MKRIETLFFLCTAMIAISGLVSCVNKEDTLLDLFPNETVVNPKVGMLIDGNYLEHATMVGENEVKGFSRLNFFETPDVFAEIIQTSSRPNPSLVANIIYQNAAYTFFTEPYYLRFGISDNYGRSWESYVLDVASPTPQDHIAGIYGMNGHKQVLVLASQLRSGGMGAYLYSYDQEARAGSVKYSFGAYTASSLCFVTDDVGWALLKSVAGDKLYISRTDDGGYQWTSPLEIGNMVAPDMVASTPMHLLVYDSQGRVSSLASTDGGYTFATGPRFSDVQFASEEKLYAINGALFYESEDAGLTWHVSSPTIYGQSVFGNRLSFFDENHGIVYAQDRLFSTADGGRTWDIAIFPYDYVFDSDYQ
ncbi:WD40/YVTN/BNR-like repeat-containing protein [Olivibacter sitiensis]|uniref:WD40/YVTN/BNR-like repeat-containing protein n=1 Tax=Olivibacter sitiensis TaxID=376470 RepID=UPI0004092D53|nr:hypothetical protein [Olivibacter sitiensis]